MSLQSLVVPEPGVEPGRIAPTVFETVASTDSAIRALCRQSYTFIFILQKDSLFLVLS